MNKITSSIFLLVLITSSVVTVMAPLAPAQTPSALNDFRTKLFYDHLEERMKSPVKTAPVGSSENGNAFTAIPDKPAVLVGLAFKKGDWFGTPIISAFQPIYESQNGRFRGARIGRKVDDFPLVVEAKAGYAVSELIVCAPKNHVHGVKIVFRKLDFSHECFAADGSYESNWAGIEFNSKSARVGDEVHPAIGLLGRADEWVASLGLICAPSLN